VSQPYVGEVRLVGFNFAPVGWQLCAGQLMPISEYNALFNLIGTTYGGDGQNTFALPDLRGRTPIHQGNGYVIGQPGGNESVSVSLNQYPAHSHSLLVSSNPANVNNATNNTLGSGPKAYSPDAPTTQMNSAMVGVSSGGSQPHSNLQPYQVLNWIISMFGVYPSQT
jgi:microcystin-dependent protein